MIRSGNYAADAFDALRDERETVAGSATTDAYWAEVNTRRKIAGAAERASKRLHELSLRLSVLPDYEGVNDLADEMIYNALDRDTLTPFIAECLKELSKTDDEAAEDLCKRMLKEICGGAT